MSARRAFATLLTSDAYLPGALTVAAALDDVHRPLESVEYETVCLVTPETVDVSTIRLLRRAFDVVVGVEAIVPPAAETFDLLGRPELDAALTKLHVFRLTQYSKVIFLDADVLPLRPLSHLFHLDHEFSAVPDVGWPDIFNSGVMVLSPCQNKFEQLRELLNTKGTWDGADQGLLNEWRGSDWNRLSFTYNTTPTAIYTYAPAYQRFGSQISAVHFIGPHKPWHSLAYRAPGSFAQSADAAMHSSAESPATQQRIHSYGSLVDHWYSVYDRHYRSQAAEPVFQPSRYTSVWNEEDLRHSIVAGGALGLEELRRAALEGMGASGIQAPRAHGDGEYQTMPLEGRFDLIRPRTRAERKQEQTSNDSIETPKSTPTVAESHTSTPEPSTPVGGILSLPPGSPIRWATLPTPGINEIPPAPHARLVSLPSTPLRHIPAPYKPLRNTREAGSQTVPFQTQHQESVGDLPVTPPNVVTPVPTDTYFPKVWGVDQNSSSISSSSSEMSLTTTEPSPKPRRTFGDPFNPSLLPATPEVLRHRGRHRDIAGDENESLTPDPTKVKRVFPWEERPRHTPGRVFPDEGSLLTAFPHVPASATPEKKPSFRSPLPSPLVGFPPSFQTQYSSEGRLPEKHTSRVPWYTSSPLSLKDEPDKAETSSQDGDVEDEVDSEEETVMRSPTRSSSIRTHTPKYRSVGVQTDQRELREEGVQVTTFVPATEVTEKLILMNRRSRRAWSTPATPTVTTTRFSTPSPLSLSMLDSPKSPLPSNLRKYKTPTTVSDEVDDLNPSLESSATASATSPSSIGGPFPHLRKGSRVWDPARGVEAFKRGSEEVLEKFMKIGSWEDRV